MSSIQERLQLKRVPLDTWNVRERLCLASAVVRSGDQNWMSVSRALKTIGEANRPQDWYSQKSCAAQYGVLLEHVETPKRKKRNSEGGVETPQESILKQLTEQRMQEIQNNVNEMNAQYEQLKNEIIEVRNPSTSVDRLQELWAEIEAARRVRERENSRRVAWLKEREEKRIKAEKSWHPQPTTTTVQATPSTPSSPLLSSLLKSTPVVTTPQHILHPNNAIETVSPSAGAPTLSLLLEQPQDNKHAAIEHIKSQLVQIEHQFKASTSGSPVPLSAPSPAPAAPAPAAPAPSAPAPAVDIDDIEIKAEDVYAFRDIDIHLPPVAAMHKGTRIEKQFKKEDEQNIMDAPQTIQEEDVKVEMSEPCIEPAVIETPSVEILEPIRVESEQKERTPEPEVAEVRISFPEVKFPTPEIKVIQPEDLKIKEEVQPKVESEPQQEETIEVEQEKEIEAPEVEVAVAPRPSTPLKEEIIEEPRPEADPEPVQKSPEVQLPPEVLLPPEVQLPPEDEPPPVPPLEAVEAVVEPPLEIPTEDIPLPPEPPATVESKIEEKEATPPPEIEPEIKQEIQEIPLPETEEIKTEESQEDEKRDEDAEDLIPLKEMIKEESSREKVKIEEDTHTETDDDTPMELSREEDKDGRTKRDYSRKKKPDSRTCSGSESAPESPSSSEAERQHRLWKKSVMLVYSRLCAHKYASLFLRPITDEEAPGYSTIVKRPMDLSTIRRNIDAGHTRTTAQFQRDVLLMLSNALMYNSSSHSVYTMAKDMFEEAQCQLGMLLAAQAHAGLVSAPPTRKRRPPPAANPNSPQYKAQRM